MNQTEGRCVETGTGHQLFVRDWGDGPPVLLLPGWGMTSNSWGGVMALLADRGFRVISYDRRGHGRSSDCGEVDYDILADDLHSVIIGRSLADVAIVAHSGAAGELLRYITRHGQDSIRSLVFVGAMGPCMLAREDNPSPIGGPVVESLLQRIAADLPGWIEENAAAFAPGASRYALDWVADMLLGCSREALISFQRAIFEADLRPEAARLACRVLLIHGDLDQSAPLELTAKRFEAISPDAILKVYQGGGHGLMLTHAERLAADIAMHARSIHRVRPGEVSDGQLPNMMTAFGAGSPSSW